MPAAARAARSRKDQDTMGLPHSNADPMTNLLLIAFFMVPVVMAALLVFRSRRAGRPRKITLRVLAAVCVMSPFILLWLLFNVVLSKP